MGTCRARAAWKNQDEKEGLRGQTDTPEFKRWFGDSKIVDRKGQPLRMFHGTDYFSGESFKPENSRSEKRMLWFTSSPMYSESASRNGRWTSQGPQTIPVYLSIKKPATYEQFLEHNKNVESLKKAGFDGAFFWNPAAGGDKHAVAFDSVQVKSAIGNRGTFDPADPNITHQDEKEGIRAKVLDNPNTTSA